MITVELDNFSLREICRSGQCFRMHETAENNTYELVAGDKYLKISQAEIIQLYTIKSSRKPTIPNPTVIKSTGITFGYWGA